MSIRSKKGRSRRGYSLGETLVAVLLLTLATSGLATGMSVAAQQYRRSVLSSQSKVLSSTLNAVLRGELENTQPERENVLRIGEEVRFYSRTYGKGCALRSQGGRAVAEGEGVYPLLGEPTYTDGMRVEELSVTWTGESFALTYTITDGAGQPVLEEALDVIPLNDLTD